VHKTYLCLEVAQTLVIILKIPDRKFGSIAARSFLAAPGAKAIVLLYAEVVERRDDRQSTLSILSEHF